MTIFELARQCYNRHTIETLFYTDGAYWEHGKNGQEYVCKSPLRHDNNPGSFKISESGLWYENAGDESGDLIDLIVMRDNCTKKEAAHIIIRAAGRESELEDNKQKKKNRTSTASKMETVGQPTETLNNVFEIIEDDAVIEQEEKQKVENDKKTIPSRDYNLDDDEIKKRLISYLSLSWQKSRHGEVVKIYQYKRNDRRGWCWTARFVKEDARITASGKPKKAIVPVYLGEDNLFHNKRVPIKKGEKYLPYGSEKLTIDYKLPVLIVQGEKCADIQVSGYILISPAYDDVKVTDWTLLKDRDCIIFPDIDSARDKWGNYPPEEKQDGMKRAIAIKKELPNSRIMDVYNYKPLSTDPSGWDIADAEKEGHNLPKLVESIPCLDIAGVALDPWCVYGRFVDDLYPDDGLEQIDGLYWRYDDKNYYWKSIIQKNIECNFQTWMNKTGIQKMLNSQNEIKPTTFYNDALSYVRRHSTGYIGENPFKESAISPYIHHRGGAIKLSDNGFEFLKREEKGDVFFKKLYPIYCFDYNYSDVDYKTFDLDNSCPAFGYVIKNIIPKERKTLPTFDDELSDTIRYISQIFAYALSPIKKNEYIFNITGSQRTGKTFFMNIIKNFIGHDFVTERGVEEMERQFSAFDLWGSKIYIDSDVSADKVIPDGFVKKYAGMIEGITVEAKHMTPIKGVKISIAMFFISNFLIKFNSKIDGVERRVCPLPFKNHLEYKDPMLLDKILGRCKKGLESGKYEGEQFSELPGILSFALHGWKSLVENDFIITLPEWVNNEKEIWKQELSTTLRFMAECRPEIEQDEDICYKTLRYQYEINRKDLYNQYIAWCHEEGLKSKGTKSFYSEIRALDYVIERDRDFIMHTDGQEEVPF